MNHLINTPSILIALAAIVFVPKLTDRRAEFLPPTFRQITFTGSASYPDLSPDGQYIAYLTGRAGGGYEIGRAHV